MKKTTMLMSVAALCLTTACTKTPTPSTNAAQPAAELADNQDADSTLGKAEEGNDAEATLDQSDMTEISYYEALRDVTAYLAPSTSAEQSEEYGMSQGAIFSASGATSISDYNDEWYECSWRADEWYYRKKDLQRHDLQGTDKLQASYLREHSPLTFRADNGQEITYYVLDQNGHSVHYDNEMLMISNPKCLYMMQTTTGDSPVVLQDSDGQVRLSNILIVVSSEEGDVNSTDGVIKDGKLMCDGYVSAFFDPDFMTEAYYIPSEQAIFMYGTLYRYVAQ